MRGIVLILMLWSIMGYGADMQKSVMNALYKQTGAENYINKTIQNLDKEYLSDTLRNNGVIIVMFLQCGITHQIGWKWEF